MTLAADLHGPEGALLLPKGLTLTERHIAGVKQRGAAEAEIVNGLDSLEPDGFPPEILRPAEDYADAVFAFSDMDQPAARVLYAICLNKAATRLARKEPLCAGSGVDARAESMGDLFLKAEGTAESLVRSEVTLASFPDIYFKIRETLDSPASSAAHIANMVGKDASLSARLLKMVNSPFYGFPRKIESIARAVVIVGGNEISMLALGISAINAFKDIPPELMNMKDFWLHSVGCGVCAKRLGEAVGGLSGERLFVAGMLHDIGRLILFKKLPHASAESVYYAQANRIPLYEAEQDVIGFTHAEVGGLLMREWKFPDELTRLAAHHHNPLHCAAPLEASVIHVADMLSMALGYSPRASNIMPALTGETWRVLGIKPEKLLDIAARADEELDAIMDVFFGPIHETGFRQ